MIRFKVDAPAPFDDMGWGVSEGLVEAAFFNQNSHVCHHVVSNQELFNIKGPEHIVKWMV